MVRFQARKFSKGGRQEVDSKDNDDDEPHKLTTEVCKSLSKDVSKGEIHNLQLA